MERFCYLPEYKVLICKPCGRAVAPTHLHTHLKSHRKEWPGLECPTAVSQLQERLQEFTLADPFQQLIPLPPSTSSALPSLPVEDGLGCKQCPFVTRSEEKMQKHLRTH